MPTAAKNLCSALFSIYLAFSAGHTIASPITFEGLTDGTTLSTEIAGASFTHATVLTSGVSLNEFEFPPHSGINVVFDDGGPLQVVFDSVQSIVEAYITYSTRVTINAFDDFGDLLATTNSLFSSNTALSGDLGSQPNEFISLSALSIRSVRITGSPLGSSFALDDLAFIPRASPVPEPSTTSLVLLVFLVTRLRHGARTYVR